MSHERKQPHFTELIWESSERNVPIPARDSSDKEWPKPLSTIKDKEKSSPSAEPSIQLQLWELETEPQEPVTTTEAQFVKRAKELENRNDTTAALFVPFKSYWPTYGHMTGAQSRWYFYWRSEIRQGRYHKTDLSYIFLHVYELINGVGWEEPIDGYRQLCQLWEAYRDSYKRLDQYLGGWIADYAFAHKLQVSLSEIVARSRGLAGDLAELELMRCLSIAPEELTFAVLTVMSDYDISKSKFYNGEGKEALELYIPQVVALINAYVTRKHGSNLVEKFPPGPPVLRERYLFRSAVYDISLYGYSVLIPVVRISKSPPLRNLITRLFRLTENKLRELMGYRGRLKGVNVDADMDELITRFLKREFNKVNEEDKRPAVVIDREKLEQLQADSEIVRTLLTVEDSDPFDEYDVAKKEDVSITITKQVEAPEVAVPIYKDINYDYGTQDFGGGTDWEQLEAALSPLQREALLTLVKEEGMSAFNKLAVANGTMSELLINEINEIAMDILGDLLIDGDELIEEYIPMLRNI